MSQHKQRYQQALTRPRQRIAPLTCALCGALTLSSLTLGEPQDSDFLSLIPDLSEATPSPAHLNDKNLALWQQAVGDNDPNLEFNQLWSQSFQQDYRHRTGGAAIGKIFRMGVKRWYNNYRHGPNRITLDHEDQTGPESDYGDRGEVDYRLRLSGDKLRLKMQYQF